MLADCRETIRQVKIASKLGEALATLVRRVKDSLPVDAFAVYLTGEEGQPTAKPKAGQMIQVPSAVFLTKALAARVVCLSVGTDELARHILAADRTNARVTAPNDALHPAVLNAIDMIVREAHAQITPVSVYGETAGEPAGGLPGVSATVRVR